VSHPVIRKLGLRHTCAGVTLNPLKVKNDHTVSRGGALPVITFTGVGACQRRNGKRFPVDVRSAGRKVAPTSVPAAEQLGLCEPCRRTGTETCSTDVNADGRGPRFFVVRLGERRTSIPGRLPGTGEPAWPHPSCCRRMRLVDAFRRWSTTGRCVDQRTVSPRPQRSQPQARTLLLALALITKQSGAAGYLSEGR
jgi:hypothetical protein